MCPRQTLEALRKQGPAKDDAVPPLPATPAAPVSGAPGALVALLDADAAELGAKAQLLLSVLPTGGSPPHASPAAASTRSRASSIALGAGDVGLDSPLPAALARSKTIASGAVMRNFATSALSDEAAEAAGESPLVFVFVFVFTCIGWTLVCRLQGLRYRPCPPARCQESRSSRRGQKRTSLLDSNWPPRILVVLGDIHCCAVPGCCSFAPFFTRNMRDCVTRV